MIACVFLLLTAGCVATNPNGEAESEPQLDQERMGLLEGEDNLIMHSRLTGQYFILEKD